MEAHCQIPNAIEKIFAASHCGVAYLGGSLTVGVGASDVSRTSWRALFNRYLYQEYHPKYHCQVSEVMGAVGASESYVAVFTLSRNVIPAKPNLALVEFCVNDLGAPDQTLVLKGMEGIVRQLLMARPSCDVIIVGSENREGTADFAPHRRVAEHYDLPFVDMRAYIRGKLKERGQTWDDIDIEFEVNDPHHLNDYGNILGFEAIREVFEEQARLFREGRRKERGAPVPEPLVSDELQYSRLIDPSKPCQGLTLEGEWERKFEGHIPWYFDNVLVGRPGARMTLEFTGTAVALFGLMYNNGLKVDAVLDGKEIPGAYLRHFIEFGKGVVLAHGLPRAPHVLKLTVAAPSKRHNKLGNPAAQIGYLAVADQSEAPDVEGAEG